MAKDKGHVETQSDPIADAQAAANQAENVNVGSGTEAGATTKSNDQNKPKKEKAPLPEGWITPVTFAKRLSEKLGKEVRPQVIYGYVRNSKEFPSKQNTDGAWIVDEAAAFSWWETKEVRKQESAAKKAEKEAKAVPAEGEATA